MTEMDELLELFQEIKILCNFIIPLMFEIKYAITMNDE